jgi:hypothetical protein
MNNILFSILGCALILSCNKSIKPSATINAEDTITYETLLTDTSAVPYYQSDDYFAFNSELNTRSVDSLYPFLTTSKKLIINDHDSTVIDTIYSYSYKENEIQIYKSAYGDFLSLYDITDTIFVLSGNIKTGITKDYFFKKFNIRSITKDTIDIGNLEQTFVVRFYFKEDKLNRIRIEPYLD